MPVLVFSDQIQDWFGYSIDGAWAAWVAPVLGTVVYTWGGSPFLSGAVAETRSRRQSDTPAAPRRSIRLLYMLDEDLLDMRHVQFLSGIPAHLTQEPPG